MNGNKGMCGGTFLKPWQVTDKIIESIFSQFTFNHLWMTQTQEIITHRVQKFTNGYKGLCMSGGKFPKPWQVTDKNIPRFVSNSHSTFYKWLKLKNNKLEGFENSQMETRGCIWVGKSYLRNHKWQIKLLSEFLCNSHSIFHKWLKPKK